MTATDPSGGALVVATHSPAETEALAAALVPHLRAGDVVLLAGELGAGKTTFTKGLAAAAGVAEVVTSPTFTLVRPYETAIGPDLLHADVYRLEQLSEVVELGLAELVEEDGFAVVEWGERAAPAFGPDALHVLIVTGPGEDDRTFELRPAGGSWAGRWAAVSGDLQAAAGVPG